MGLLAGALPQSGQPSIAPRAQYGPSDVSGMFPLSNAYPLPQGSQFPVGRGTQIDPAAIARAQQQQQQYMSSQYASMQQPNPMGPRAGQFSPLDPYGIGLSPMPISPLDPRFASRSPFSMPPNMPGDFSQFSRHPSEPALVPSFPRGPPRKPKQSGHALWVGNLPPAATVTDLKDHFSRDATKDIESLFLISKSNCAFVNYRSEAACVAAMTRFHDSRFHGVRLVCRLRRGAAAGSSSATPVTGDVSEPPSSNDSPAGSASPAVAEEPSGPTIVASSLPPPPSATSSQAITNSNALKVPEKFFIVKSLTVQDLEASVRNGIWATQSHNEASLSRAYEEADNVYLIFSANKSGEYFGYARMASAISGEPVNLSLGSTPDEPRSSGAPQSIPTPATATAPRGRVIDDSARGTIFWEAEHSDGDDDESPEKESGESASGQNWGRQFTIEWLSTTRLPFYRTRGLRNPWNANREVKIARDGTELESDIGRRLVQMFHRPSPGPGAAAPQHTMPYR